MENKIGKQISAGINGYSCNWTDANIYGLPDTEQNEMTQKHGFNRVLIPATQPNELSAKANTGSVIDPSNQFFFATEGSGTELRFLTPSLNGNSETNYGIYSFDGINNKRITSDFTDYNEIPRCDISCIEIRYIKAFNNIRRNLETNYGQQFGNPLSNPPSVSAAAGQLPPYALETDGTGASSGDAYSTEILENISTVEDVNGNVQPIDNIKMDSVYVIKTQAILDNLSAYRMEARLYNKLNFTIPFEFANAYKKIYTAQDPHGVITGVSFEDNITQQYRINGEDSILYFDLSKNNGSEPWHKAGGNGVVKAFQVRIKDITKPAQDSSAVYTINPMKIKLKGGDGVTGGTDATRVLTYFNGMNAADKSYQVQFDEDTFKDTNDGTDIALSTVLKDHNDGADFDFDVRVLTGPVYEYIKNNYDQNYCWVNSINTLRTANKPQPAKSFGSEELQIARDNIYQDHGKNSVIKFQTPDNIASGIPNEPFDGINSYNNNNLDLSFIRLKFTTTQGNHVVIRDYITANTSNNVDINVSDLESNTVYEINTNDSPYDGAETLKNDNIYNVEIQLANRTTDNSNNVNYLLSDVKSAMDYKLITAHQPNETLNNLRIDHSSLQYRDHGEKTTIYFDTSSNINGAPWHKAGFDGNVTKFQLQVKQGGTTTIYDISNDVIILNSDGQLSSASDVFDKQQKAIDMADKSLQFTLNDKMLKDDTGAEKLLSEIFNNSDTNEGIHYELKVRAVTSPFGQDDYDHLSDINFTTQNAELYTAKKPFEISNNAVNGNTLDIRLPTQYTIKGRGTRIDFKTQPNRNTNDSQSNTNVEPFDGLNSDINSNCDISYITAKYIKIGGTASDIVEENIFKVFKVLSDSQEQEEYIDVKDILSNQQYSFETLSGEGPPVLTNLNEYDVSICLTNTLDYTGDYTATTNNTTLKTAAKPENVIVDASFAVGRRQYRSHGEDSKFYFEISGNINGAPWHKSGYKADISYVQIKVTQEANSQIYTVSNELIFEDESTTVKFPFLTSANHAAENKTYRIDFSDNTFYSRDGFTNSPIPLHQIFNNNPSVNPTPYTVAVRILPEPILFDNANILRDSDYCFDARANFVTAVEPSSALVHVTTGNVLDLSTAQLYQDRGVNSYIKFKTPTFYTDSNNVIKPFDGINSTPIYGIGGCDLSCIEVKYTNTSDSNDIKYENITRVGFGDGVNMTAISVREMSYNCVYDFSTTALLTNLTEYDTEIRYINQLDYSIVIYIK